SRFRPEGGFTRAGLTNPARHRDTAERLRDPLPVHPLTAQQVVFGDRGIVPPRDEVLVERSVEARRILTGSKDVLRQEADVDRGMVVPHPRVSAEDGGL